MPAAATFEGGKPMLGEPMPRSAMVALVIAVVVPFLALLAAVPVGWGWGLSWRDLAIALAAYLISGSGATVGFHRYFTHGSFKAVRWLRITLAAAGSLALEGEVIQWVADHRRHHAYADREGDPHSPWRYGASATRLAKGLFYAHYGWLFQRQWSNRERFAPDLPADRDIVRVDRYFGPLAAFSLLAPPALGGPPRRLRRCAAGVG
jgi:stearoyl-CoA desaturase (delta-9 desaturase)